MKKRRQKMQGRKLLAMTAAAALAAAMNGPLAFAADWPQRPVRMIVPYTPGGGTDSIARVLAEKMTKADNGINFVIENKPGAGGNIGMAQVARAKADGLTLGLGQTAN